MISLQTLGGLRVSSDGADVPGFTTKPLRAAMLVYVAVEGLVTRERLCHLLWPESHSRRARRALSQTLLELRRELGRSWVDAEGDHLRITGGMRVDLAEFADAVREGRLADAIAAYRGPFLEGVRLGRGIEYEHWAEGKRSEAHRVARGALRDLTASSADPAVRTGLASRWVALDPLDDEAQHALIESLAREGRRTEALDHYAAYRALIERELEVTPLEQTEELVERIRAGELSASIWQPADRLTHETLSGEESGAKSPSGGHPPSGFELAAGLEVARRIGSGSTGSVYLAREPALGRLVAVKVLDPDLAAYPPARARFEREMRMAARVFHPNVATVHHVGETSDGTLYFVMPYIKGVTLADRLRAEGPLSAREVRRLLAELASALAAAHEAGVIHRDVRPANVLYEEATGRSYLVDFGVAGVLESADEETVRLTRSGELLGNAEYVSPEQGRGDPTDDRSDVFSLGVMGWELLMGRPSAGRAATNPPIDDHDLTDWLRRATSENPRRRPSAAQLARVLSARPDSTPGSQGLFRQLSHRRVLPIVGAYLAAGVAGLGGVDQLVQQGLLTSSAYRLALASFVAGLNASILFAWFHGAKGRQRFSRMELALYAVIVIGWIIGTLLIAA